MALGDRNFERINDNLRKMFKGGASRTQIDRYVAAEGVTADEIKAFNTQQNFDTMMQPGAVTTVSPQGTAKTQTKQQFEQAQKPLTGSETSEARAEAVVKGIPLIGGLISPAIQAGLGEAFELFGKAPEKTFKERFLEARKEFKARQEKLQTESPKLALGLELAGGIPASIGAVGLLGKAGKAIAPAVKGIKKVPALAKALTTVGETAPVRFLGTKAGKLIGTGAGFGGAFEAGQVLSEKGAEEKRLPTTAEVLKGAGKGLLTGGLTAGVLGAGVGTAKGILGTLSRATKPSKFLIKKLGKDVIREAQQKGISLLETSSGLRAGQKVLKAGKTAAKLSEDAAEILQKSTTEKLKGLPQRLKGTLDELFGKSGLQDIDNTIQKFTPLRNQLFKKAITKGIDPAKTNSISKLKNLIKSRDAFKPTGSAMKELKAIAEAEGFQVPANLAEEGFNLKNLMLTKRGLSTVIDAETSFDPVTFAKKVSPKGQAFIELQKNFLKLVDDIAPDYAIARKATSDNFGLKNAVIFGKQALKKTPYEIEKGIKDFGDAEMEAFLISIKEELLKKSQRIATTENKDIFTALFKASKDFDLRKKLEPILGKQSFDKFQKFLGQEHIKNFTLSETLKQAKSTLLTAEKAVVPKEAIGLAGVPVRTAGGVVAEKTEIPFQTRIAQFLTDPELLKTINVKEATALQKALKGQVARTSGQIGAGLF